MVACLCNEEGERVLKRRCQKSFVVPGLRNKSPSRGAVCPSRHAAPIGRSAPPKNLGGAGGACPSLAVRLGEAVGKQRERTGEELELARMCSLSEHFIEFNMLDVKVAPKSM